MSQLHECLLQRLGLSGNAFQQLWIAVVLFVNNYAFVLHKISAHATNMERSDPILADNISKNLELLATSYSTVVSYPVVVMVVQHSFTPSTLRNAATQCSIAFEADCNSRLG